MASFDRKPLRISSLTRRDAVKSMVFAGGALVFAGPGRINGVLAQDKIKLSQWYHEYGEAGTEDAVKRYGEEFTASPEGANIELEVVWNKGDYGSILNPALLTDEGPDVYEQGVPTLDQVAQNQVVALDELFTPEVLADFNPVNISVATIDGKIYQVKMIDDTGGLYYKKSVLEGAGVTPPTTMDELIAAVKTLDSGRVKALFVGNDAGIGALAGLSLYNAGGTWLSEDNTAPVFNTPETAASLLKLKELIDTGALLQGFTTDYWDPTAFIQGACAMQWTGLWAFPAISEAVGEDFDVVPWPSAGGATGTPATFFGGWGQCVNGKRPEANIAAAKTLVKWFWIDNTELQQDWALSYGFHVPPRASAAASAEPLKTGVPAKFVEILTQYGKTNTPYWTAAMGTAYSDAVTNIVRNGADATAELTKAEDTVKAELQRLLGA